jgi:uncharacterized protein
MKRLILTTILGLALTTAAHAQEAQAAKEPMLIVAQATPEDDAARRLQMAERFIELMQVDQMSEMMQGLVSSMVPPSSRDLPPREQRMLADALAEAVGQIMPRMFEAMAPVYAEIFTLQELEDLVAFYESPTGLAFVSKSYEALPQITAAVNAIMPEILNDMATNLCASLECSQDELRQMKAEIAQIYPAQ